MEHKHLLYEGKQFCKQTRLLMAEGRRYPPSYSRLFSCLFSMCGKFSLVRICEVKDKLGCVFTENRGQQETVFAC